MADLRANPTLNRMQIDKAFSDLRESKPGLAQAFGDTPIDIRLGNIRDRGFGETYLPGEEGPPDKPAPGNPDHLRIELRKGRTGSTDDKKGFIMGELLHQLGAKKQDGTDFSPEFMALKKALLLSLTEDQLQEAEFLFKKNYQGETGSNFESFPAYMMSSGGDELIRGGILPEGLTDPEERERFERTDGTGQFNEEQLMILDKIRAFLSGEVSPEVSPIGLDSRIREMPDEDNRFIVEREQKLAQEYEELLGEQGKQNMLGQTRYQIPGMKLDPGTNYNIRDFGMERFTGEGVGIIRERNKSKRRRPAGSI